MRLEARGVGVHYGQHIALASVDAEVESGQVLGVIGPNGSGKSTLIRVLAGVLAPQTGSVSLDGAPLSRLRRRERARRIALVPQETHLSFPIRVRELAMLGRSPHMGRFGSERAADRSVVDEALARTDVLEIADRPLDSLSGGERQRAVLARALAQEPALLLLDEPTTYLDLRHAVDLLDLVKLLARRDGLAVVLVLHDLNLAAMYCDRLLLLSQGRLHSSGAPQAVLSYEDLCAVYGTELYVAPNDVTGLVVVLPLAREHRDRLGRSRVT